MLIHCIWLAHLPRLSDRSKTLLLQHFQDPEEIYFADREDLLKIEGLSRDALTALENKDLDPAQDILEVCLRKKLEILTIQDPEYPSRLKNIFDPPVVLYYKGRLPDFDGTPVIGVVGTRRASFYGQKTANRMGYQIGRCGGIVVSGMAKGIDALAMEGALMAGLPTVGVLGCGVDVVYPACNRSLFRDVEGYGCILSEFAPGTQPARWTFPKRNRIISGLSNGVLIVEAPEKSGALITANLALEQGRDVFVVPGNIDEPGFVGSNRLLRDGAYLVSSGWEILREYEAMYPDKVHQDTVPFRPTPEGHPVPEAPENPENSMPKVAQNTLQPEKKQNLKKELEKKAIDKTSSGTYIDVNNVSGRLSTEEKAVVAALENGERLVDDVIAETGFSTGKLLAMLTMLELKGIIRRLPGKRIARK